MTHYTDRWLLPDGVEEILPDDAQRIEQLRRCLLDIYRRWGYQLVIHHCWNLLILCLLVLATI